MKIRYTALLAVFALTLCVFSLAYTSRTESDFFGAESLLDKSDVSIFDLSDKEGYTAFSVEEKNGENSIGYCVYVDNNGGYYLESPHNFDFTAHFEGVCDEFSIPYDLISCFVNSEKMYADYSDFTAKFQKALKDNVSENDFSSSAKYIEYNGSWKRCDIITLDADISPVFLQDLDAIFGFYHIPEELKHINFTKNIIDGSIIEQTLLVTTSANTYTLDFSDKTDNFYSAFEIRLTDANGEIDFYLSYKKSGNNETLAYKNLSSSIEIISKNGEISALMSDDGLTDIKISVLPEYNPIGTVYDMGSSRQKGEMFAKLSRYLTANQNAALLFRTYEVNLEK